MPREDQEFRRYYLEMDGQRREWLERREMENNDWLQGQDATTEQKLRYKGTVLQDGNDIENLKADYSSRVNHPPHYNQGDIETIAIIDDMGIGEAFCLGNAIKYLHRCKFKENPRQDIEKAIWYCQRLLKYYE